MDEMKMYQEGQAAGGGQPQAATMPDMLEQMRQIFADRDAEYTRMEQAYQKRKESLDAKEASLLETLSGLEDRLSVVTAREEEVQEKETQLQETLQSLTKEKAALQEAQTELEKEKTEQWMKVSLLREEARNEKLRSQRLAGEYEEKLSKLPADSPYLSVLQETAGQAARKQMEEKIAAMETALRQKEQTIIEMQAENEGREVQIAALQGTVGRQKEELEKGKEENRQLKAKNEYLTKTNQELEELSQILPEQQKQDMESLHTLAKELTEKKEALEEENRRLMEENRRLQEEKGELFKKLMAGTQPGTQEREGWQEKRDREEKNGVTPSRNTEEIEEDDRDADEEGPGQADVLPVEEPLTAEVLQEYLEENGADTRLLHSSEGELVAVTADNLQIMFSFREPPRFDIRKKQKSGWSIKKLLKRYNENKAGLTFTYEETEEEFIGSGEFSLSMSPDELVYTVYQAARIYFGYQNKEEK